MKIKAFIFLALSIFLLSHPVQAQGTIDIQTAQKQLAEKQTKLDTYELLFTKENVTEQDLSNARQEIKVIRSSLQELSDTVKPVYDLTKAELDDLGAAPTAPEGEEPPAEPDNIKAMRQSLQDKVSKLEGITIQIDASLSKSTRFLERLAGLRRERFVGKVLQRHILPFEPSLWTSAIEAKNTVILSEIKTIRLIVFKDDHLRASIFVSLLAFCMIFFPACFLTRRALQKRIADYSPDQRQALLYHVSLSIIVPVVAGFVGLAIIYQSARAAGIIQEETGAPVFLLANFLIFVTILMSRLVFARLVRRKIRLLYVSAAFLYAADILLAQAGENANAPFEFSLAQSYIVTGIFSALMMLFSLSILQKERRRQKALEQQAKDSGSAEDEPAKGPSIITRFYLPQQVVFIFMATGLFILGADAAGYVALSHYIFNLLIRAFTFAAFLLILRALIRPVISQIDLMLYAHRDEPRKEEDRFLFFWLSLAVDIAIACVSLPVWAGILGFAWEDIRDSVIHAFFGIQIGGINISMANIGVAIVLFIILLTATRFVQRIFGQKILPRTKIESSVQQSLTQIMGYIGLIVAFMASVSAMGFDLSNLALIAGALSVGIGFGLQSIVSNFVSGLILLFERPIKVGDWVIVESGQGMVKKISVRATEIETFDRTSIIVPNSELISSSVKNWTYKDRIGRAIITVGVSYNSDPRLVYDLLLECAQNHPLLVRYPEPSVVFVDFGDSALIFELRVFLRNIREVFDATNDIRFKIWDKFKEHNIEIPFPQQDIHIRGGEGLKGIINGK
ncbi:MAG: mechanosensitive ion channel family protein [Alphaproteobacteria bacterium]|nr:mechanosensitive ion channel family protein [Alphaproteobacteria bacterium]